MMVNRDFGTRNLEAHQPSYLENSTAEFAAKTHKDSIVRWQCTLFVPSTSIQSLRGPGPRRFHKTFGNASMISANPFETPAIEIGFAFFSLRLAGSHMRFGHAPIGWAFFAMRSAGLIPARPVPSAELITAHLWVASG